MKKILIACTHSIIRLGINALVADLHGSHTADFAEDATDLLIMLKAKEYDLLITDIISLSSEKDRPSIEKLQQVQPALKTLIISSFPEIIFAKRFLDAGAWGYVQTDSKDEKIRTAIGTLLAGKRYMSMEVMRRISESSIGLEPTNPFDKLSPAEFKVVMLLLKGLGTSDIANILGVHTSTASTHKIRIFEKLQVLNVFELLGLASSFNITEDKASRQ